MGKQKIGIIITVLFVTVSGIFYSVNYGKREEAVFLVEENANEASQDGYFLEADISESQSDISSLETDEETEKAAQAIETKALIYVHICGQIMSPGVYCLEEESRITDLIQMAGGFTKSAAKDYINQAQKLSDGQRIYIPTLDEVAGDGLFDEAGMTGQQENSSAKVNINTADEAALMTLTGIGKAKAEAIIEYREKHGGFDSIEELKQIEGIKDGVFNKIKDEIEV